MFLDRAYRERMRAERGEFGEEDEYESEWDPIEDIIEGERQSFVEMMRRLLWLDDRGSAFEEGVEEDGGGVAESSHVGGASPASADKENVEPVNEVSRVQGCAAPKAPRVNFISTPTFQPHIPGPPFRYHLSGTTFQDHLLC